jgi:glutamate-1-semialdehyde 2,1-aminomutase
MVAGHGMLSHLKKNSSLYSKINTLGQRARKELDKIFDGKVITTGKGSLFMTHFLADGVSEIRNASDAARCDSAVLHKYHFNMIATNGIFFLPGKLGAFSAAHSQSDVKNLIDASQQFSVSM